MDDELINILVAQNAIDFESILFASNIEQIQISTQKAPIGWGLGRGIPCPFGVWFEEGLYPSPEHFVLIHVKYIHFAAFCENYNSLRMTIFS